MSRAGKGGSIGRWQIVGGLGSGGMGTVYLGRSGDELAAVKVVHPGLADDPTFRARFRREIALSTRVRGPHVAELLDADPDAEVPWLAARYIEGPTLWNHVARHGPLDDRQVAVIGLALASALRDIHAVGVVHRDLKPSNVVLGPSAPVVIDFGIAAAADATTLTATGTTLGSAGWMAPELLTSGTAGPPSDVFAWGAVLFFTATGRNPFGSGGMEAMAYRVVHESPDLEGAPAWLVPYLQRSLAKDPAARPSPELLIRDLRPAVGNAPTLADAVTRLWVPPTNETSLAPTHTPVAAGAPTDHVAPRRGLWVATAVIALLFAIGVALGLRNGDSPDSEATDSTATTTAVASTSATTASTSATPTTTGTAVRQPASSERASGSTTRGAELSGRIDPSDGPDVMGIVNFVDAHLQEEVILDLWFEDPSDDRIFEARPDDDPAFVWVRGDCPVEELYCEGGFEMLIEDLDRVSDASLHYEHGGWVLRGHFALQHLSIHMGVFSIAMRALPIA